MNTRPLTRPLCGIRCTSEFIAAKLMAIPDRKSKRIIFVWDEAVYSALLSSATARNCDAANDRDSVIMVLARG